MSMNRLVAWITFLAVFAMAARVSVDSDTWWHLRAGQWMLENRAILQVDHFSYTRAGQPWQYPGWLVEVPMIWMYQLAGPGGLNLWTAFMVTLTFAFTWRTLSGGVFLRAFVIVLAAAVSGVYWAARPYLVTFLLAAIYLWLLEEFRWQPGARSSRRLYWLPGLMLVWVNSHGGFAAGFLIWGIYWLDRMVAWALERTGLRPLKPGETSSNWPSLRRLTLIGLLMFAAVCANPAGPAMLLYPFKTVSIGALQDYIAEWQSPDFHLRSTQPFIWLLLLTFGAVAVSRRRIALTDFLLTAGFTYMALLAVRNMALFALALPPVLTRHAAPLMAALARRSGLRLSPPSPTRWQSRLNGLIFGLLLLLVILKAASVISLDANLAEFRKTLPVDAVAFLRAESPPGRLFNAYNWGGYLLWELPDYPVFIDGRTDLYNDEIIQQWLQVVRAEPGWQSLLDTWQVRLILLEPSMPVVAHLEQNGWRKAFGDELSVVYLR